MFYLTSVSKEAAKFCIYLFYTYGIIIFVLETLSLSLTHTQSLFLSHMELYNYMRLEELIFTFFFFFYSSHDYDYWMNSDSKLLKSPKLLKSILLDRSGEMECEINTSDLNFKCTSSLELPSYARCASSLASRKQ